MTKKTFNEEDDISNTISKKNLEKFLNKIEKQQYNGPFTLRDSGIIEEFQEKLKSNAVNYDDEPVTACPMCNNLYLKELDGKLECFNCGNEIEEKDVIVFSSIHKYLEYVKELEKESKL